MPDISSASAAPKIYTINGPSSTSSSTLPTWITTKPRTKSSSKRQRTQHTLGQLELIQDFTFPQAANRIKTTPDGLYAVGTGTYKPMIKVWDLEGLTEKFTRVTEAENVDFVMLSSDWTKSLHLQADRSVSVHTQGGLHHSLRLPTYGRCVAYHSPSCEALVGCTGRQVHRLNLEEGRFMQPLEVGGGRADVEGVNCVDVNARHGLWAFGLDGVDTRQIEFWDPRSRSALTSLSLPSASLRPTGATTSAAVGITALTSHPSDGLSLAVGTSTGHTLLYDVRSPTPLAIKDQGYGEAVRHVAWLSGDAGEGKVLSADTKVVKVWERQDPSSNVFSLHPPAPLTSIHPIPGTGLLLASTDSPALSTYYVPDLGPAPRWASFLDGITEELEDDPGQSKGAYSDFKFVDRKELDVLGLSHLIGTPTLKPYMHGFFLSLKLYQTARLIANPTSYAEHRAKTIADKLDKQAGSRIRARREGVKVNKALAERVRRAEEREAEKETRKRGRAGDAEDAAGGEPNEMKTILQDPRFKELWENPDFEVDEDSREFGLLNPATANNNAKRKKTAVEEEDEESDRMSSDGISQSGSESEEDEDAEDASDDDQAIGGGVQSEEDEDSEEDSDEEGDLRQYDPRNWKKTERPTKGSSLARVGEKRKDRPRLIAGDDETAGDGRPRPGKALATFGQRLKRDSSQSQRQRGARSDDEPLTMRRTADGGMEMSFIPKASSGRGADDMLSADYQPGMDKAKLSAADGKRDKKVQRFAAGLEKGGYTGRANGEREMSEAERKGRTGRRHPGRSASKNVFRGM